MGLIDLAPQTVERRGNAQHSKRFSVTNRQHVEGAHLKKMFGGSLLRRMPTDSSSLVRISLCPVGLLASSTCTQGCRLYLCWLVQHTFGSAMRAKRTRHVHAHASRAHHEQKVCAFAHRNDLPPSACTGKKVVPRMRDNGNHETTS